MRPTCQIVYNTEHRMLNARLVQCFLQLSSSIQRLRLLFEPDISLVSKLFFYQHVALTVPPFCVKDYILQRKIVSEVMSEEAPTAAKSPDSSLIAGLVAGIFSFLLLIFIFYILWRTRNSSSLLPSQPEKIIPIRESSKNSSRTQSGIGLASPVPGGAKASADNVLRRSQISSTSHLGTSPNSSDQVPSMV